MPWRGPRVEGEFPTAGYLIGDWIEANLVIPDRERMGEPYLLTDEMWTHLLWRYRLRPDARAEDGQDAFVYGGSLLVRGQKWGKDPFKGAACLAHVFGPALFDGWDASGEPVLRPHPSPWVAVAATNDDQTDNTFRPIREMIRQGPLANVAGVDADKTMISVNGQEVIEPLTTTSFGRLGSPFTHVSITEAGLLVGEGKRGGLSFARTLKRNVGGMNGMWDASSNAWDPTEGSDAQRTYEAKDPHVFLDVRLARRHVDLADDDALTEEIRYGYGDSLVSRGGWVSERRIMADCRNRAMGESEVRRFYLGELTSGEKPLTTVSELAAAVRTNETLQPGEPIALGFDGSRARDATTLIASRMSDGRAFEIATWFPTETGGKVDRIDVDNTVDATFSGFEVVMMFADPYLWQDYLDVWANRYGAERVVEFPTNVERRMDAAIELFRTALHAGEWTYDGSKNITDAMNAAALAKGKKKPPRLDGEGLPDEHYLKVVKKRDDLIDACVGTILAGAARGKALESGWEIQSETEIHVW